MRIIRYCCALIALPVLISYLLILQKDPDKLIELSYNSSPITITRDDYGIPRIKALTTEAALYGLGYVQGQDRLWQIDIVRRVASGTLSELLGAKALDLDVFIRNIKIPHKAKQEILAQTPKDLQLIQDYINGINDAAKTNRLPIEYYFTWSNWQNIELYQVHCASYFISFVLSSMWGTDLLRHELYKIIGEEAFYIVPTDLLDPKTFIINSEELPQEIRKSSAFGQKFERSEFLEELRNLDTFFEVSEQNSGSNAWVISGKFTASGKPILANDPHLPSTAPSTWYLFHMELPYNTISGASYPSNPIVPLGRNKDLAWGITALKADTVDLYVEKVKGNTYLYGENFVDLTEFEETINVRGEGEKKCLFKETLHGPILNNSIVGGTKFVTSLPLYTEKNLAFAWSLYSSKDRYSECLRIMLNASSVHDMRKALFYMDSLSLGIISGSVNGDIAFQSIGIVPIRNNDGTLPVPGWVVENTWQGFIPYEEMPYVINPEKGYIIMGNNFVTEQNYKYFESFGKYFSHGRAERIDEIITQKIQKHQKFTSQDQSVMMQDELSIFARTSVPKWLEMVIFNEKFRKEYTEMQNWDYVLDKNSREAAVYSIWIRNVLRNLLIDRVPEGLLMNFLRSLLSQLSSYLFFEEFYPSLASLCDNPTTDSIETCKDFITKAFEEACTEASQRTYGEIHNIIPEHNLLSKLPLLNKLVEMKQPVGGTYHTIHAMQTNWGTDFNSKHGPGVKFVVDLGNPDDNLWAVETGQSGNPFSKHFSDMFQFFHTENIIRWKYQEFS